VNYDNSPVVTITVTCESWAHRVVIIYLHVVPSTGRHRPKLFELCAIFLNYVQHIFPGGAKMFSPPGYGPASTYRFQSCAAIKRLPIISFTETRKAKQQR